MLSARPSKKHQCGNDGRFVWRPRLPLLREHAWFTGQDAVGAIYTDVPRLRCRGAAPGDRFIQGEWPKLVMREGVNWKEPWVLKTALEPWGACLAGRLALARMGNSTAASYANYSAGKVPYLTRLVRCIK